MRNKKIITILILIVALVITSIVLIVRKGETEFTNGVGKYCHRGLDDIHKQDADIIREYIENEGDTSKIEDKSFSYNCKSKNKIFYKNSDGLGISLSYSIKDKKVINYGVAPYSESPQYALKDKSGTSYILFIQTWPKYGLWDYNLLSLGRDEVVQEISTYSHPDLDNDETIPLQNNCFKETASGAKITTAGRINEFQVKDINSDGLNDIYFKHEEFDCSKNIHKSYVEKWIADKKGFTKMQEEIKNGK